MPDNSAPFEESSWNEFLKAHNIFSDEIDTIQSKVLNKTAILNELNNLLQQDDVLQTLLDRYFDEFKVLADNTDKCREIFLKNILAVAEHNIDAKRGLQTWYDGVNRFTYMSDAEFMTECEFSHHAPKEPKLRRIYLRFRSCVVCSCIRKMRQ